MADKEKYMAGGWECVRCGRAVEAGPCCADARGNTSVRPAADFPTNPEMEFRRITQPEINRSRSALLESLRRATNG